MPPEAAKASGFPRGYAKLARVGQALERSCKSSLMSVASPSPVTISPRNTIGAVANPRSVEMDTLCWIANESVRTPSVQSASQDAVTPPAPSADARNPNPQDIRSHRMTLPASHPNSTNPLAVGLPPSIAVSAARARWLARLPPAHRRRLRHRQKRGESYRTGRQRESECNRRSANSCEGSRGLDPGPLRASSEYTIHPPHGGARRFSTERSHHPPSMLLEQGAHFGKVIACRCARSRER
jgi:hypothetical protein